MCALLTLQILPNGAILPGEEVPLAHTRCTGSKEQGVLFEVPRGSEGNVSHCPVTNDRLSLPSLTGCLQWMSLLFRCRSAKCRWRAGSDFQQNRQSLITPTLCFVFNRSDRETSGSCYRVPEIVVHKRGGKK